MTLPSFITSILSEKVLVKQNSIFRQTPPPPEGAGGRLGKPREEPLRGCCGSSMLSACREMEGVAPRGGSLLLGGAGVGRKWERRIHHDPDPIMVSISAIVHRSEKHPSPAALVRRQSGMDYRRGFVGDVRHPTNFAHRIRQRVHHVP